MVFIKIEYFFSYIETFADGFGHRAEMHFLHVQEHWSLFSFNQAFLRVSGLSLEALLNFIESHSVMAQNQLST